MMSQSQNSNLRIVMAQQDFLVGAIDANAEQILAACEQARDEMAAHIIVFPELALTGYPPEDLLFRAHFIEHVGHAMDRLCAGISGITAIVGFPLRQADALYNAAAVISDGGVTAVYRKQHLPNYGVFDEKRVFRPGPMPGPLNLRGLRVGVPICEDIWIEDVVECLEETGTELLIVPNGSPFEHDKQDVRLNLAVARVTETGLPLIYCNQVGGQDELVFDGGSLVLDAQGRVVQRAPSCVEGLYPVDFHAKAGAVIPLPGECAPHLDTAESIYRVLVLGVRDYIRKNGFPGAVIGLSGGIDSALVLAMAVDALGAERVHAVMMPSRFTSTISLEDAEAMARGLRVKYSLLPIEAMFEAALETLAAEFRGLPEDATEENIQARCRGILLMAISNKTGRIVLTTGNKSEMAVGYATLYGDMAGGFAPIKDCSKLLVFRLARWRNTRGAVIPQRIIDRPPSAELRADQKDTDSLPPYEVLDPILEAFIERDLSVEEIVELGYERAIVVRILELVRCNEYKRRQAPPGVRISARAFGRDWRYPITSGYRVADT